MKSFQKGHIKARKTRRHGLVHVIRYRAQRPDGAWKLMSETIHTRFRKEAEKVLSDRLAEINNGAKLPSEIAFKEFVEQQWETYLANLKPSTQASHRSNVKTHLLPIFGTQQLTEIRPAQLERFFATAPITELSTKSRLNLYLLLGKMFNHAVELELIPSSPMRKAFKPSVQRMEKPALHPDQIRAIVKAAPAQYRALFVLLSLTSLRIGEVLGLKWSDIDFDKLEFYIRRSVWRGKEQSPKSKASSRKKQMGPVLVQALEFHRSISNYTDPENYVFTNGAGNTVNPDDLRKRVLYPAMDEAGISRTARAFGFHVLRHSAGTILGEQENVNLKQVSSFMGHSSTAITGDVYMHLNADVERAVAEKLETAIYTANEDLFAFVHKTTGAVN